MILFVEIVLIFLLAMILLMIYGNERRSSSKKMSRAKVEEYWDGKERRKHVRFNQELNVVYVIEKKSHLKQNGKTVDISYGGMKLLMDDKLVKGTLIDIFLSLSDRSENIEIEGTVAWSEEAGLEDSTGKRYFHTGIEFKAVKESCARAFSEYINSLSRKAKAA